MTDPNLDLGILYRGGVAAPTQQESDEERVAVAAQTINPGTPYAYHPVLKYTGPRLADLNALIAGGVTSFEGRTGAVVSVVGDYNSDEVDNESTVPGTSVTNALDNLQDAINVSNDHGALTGRDDDDHSLYLPAARPTDPGDDGKVLTASGGVASWQAPVTGVTDHGLLTGRDDDDHSLYLPADRPANPADDGKVLTASGGVASWQTPSGGGGSEEVGWDGRVGNFPTAIKTTTATSTSAEEYTLTELNGELGTGTSNKQFVATAYVSTQTGAYTPGSTITFTGTLAGGAPKTDVLTIVGANGNEYLTGDEYFDTITKIEVQAQADTDGSIQFGAQWTGDWIVAVDLDDFVQIAGDFAVVPVAVRFSVMVTHREGCAWDLADYDALWLVSRTSGTYSITNGHIRAVPNLWSGSNSLTSGEKTITGVKGFDANGHVVIGITDLVGSSLSSVDAYESARTKGTEQFKAGAYSGASETVVTTATSAFDWLAHVAPPATPTISNSGSELRATLPITATALVGVACYLNGTYKVRPTYRDTVLIVG